MSTDPSDPSGPEESAFARAVAAQAARKLKRQARGDQSVWFGLGLFGLIGWSLAVPTVLGALLGFRLDHRSKGTHSWTLALLAAGLFVGCLNAWRWMTREGKAMQDKPEGDDE